MADTDDDDHANPPDPAASPQASTADAPAPADTPAPVSDPAPAPVDSAPPDPNQSVADTPAPAEPNASAEPSGSILNTTSPEGDTDSSMTNTEGTAADRSTQPILTDEHYDWIHKLSGKNAREDSQAAEGGSSQAPPPGDASSASGGFFSGLASAVSDAASGVVSTVSNVANDVGKTVFDTASGIANTVETAASGVVTTVSDAASGVVDTAKTVAGDVAAGNYPDALGDAEKGVVTTTAKVVDDSVHAVVNTGGALLDTAGKIITDSNQAMTDAATGAISTAGKVVSDTAQGVAQAAGPDSIIGQAASAVSNASTTVASDAVSGINTLNDFHKGVVEGVVGGVEGMAKGLVTSGEGVAKEGYALATDKKAREQAAATILHGAEAVGQFEATMITDPNKAMGQVADAASSAANTVENTAGKVYKDYQTAAAAGHGAEFLGKGVGQAAVVVAGAVLTDGASVAGEGAAVAGEGAALVGEGAAVVGEGAAVSGEGAAVASEGATAVGEGGSAIAEAGSAIAEAGETEESLAAGEGAGGSSEAGIAPREDSLGEAPANEAQAGDAKGQLSRDEAYLAEADPARRVMGAAKESHPEEIANMRAELESSGVEVKEREDAIAYAPGLKPGSPGQITLDPEASYSAWLHEYQHFLDDKAAGWGGMKGMMDVANRVQMEERAYAKEIELATKLGHEDVANDLRENLAQELRTIKGEE